MDQEYMVECQQTTRRVISKIQLAHRHREKFKNVNDKLSLDANLFSDKSIQVAKLLDLFWHYITNQDPSSADCLEILLAFESLLNPPLDSMLSVPLPKIQHQA